MRDIENAKQLVQPLPLPQGDGLSSGINFPERVYRQFFIIICRRLPLKAVCEKVKAPSNIPFIAIISTFYVPTENDLRVHSDICHFDVAGTNVVKIDPMRPWYILQKCNWHTSTVMLSISLCRTQGSAYYISVCSEWQDTRWGVLGYFGLKEIVWDSDILQKSCTIRPWKKIY